MDKDFLGRREIEQDLWELEKRQSMHHKFETIMKIYSLLGLIIAVFGIGYFLFTILEIKLNTTQQMTLLISGIGMGVSLASWVFLLIRRERANEYVKKLQSMQELSEFLWKWSKFENISKNILETQGKEFNRFSIREIIDRLYEVQLINKEDVLFLEEAIQSRNMVVHTGRLIPREMLTRYSSQLNEIISKLKQ
ncbi:MAG: hypothetical protein ACYDGO_08345 [Smithellaceae bacterium]